LKGADKVQEHVTSSLMKPAQRCGAKTLTLGLWAVLSGCAAHPLEREIVCRELTLSGYIRSLTCVLHPFEVISLQGSAGHRLMVEIEVFTSGPGDPDQIKS
jgi:hypothetical protein